MAAALFPGRLKGLSDLGGGYGLEEGSCSRRLQGGPASRTRGLGPCSEGAWAPFKARLCLEILMKLNQGPPFSVLHWVPKVMFPDPIRVSPQRAEQLGAGSCRHPY